MKNLPHRLWLFAESVVLHAFWPFALAFLLFMLLSLLLDVSGAFLDFLELEAFEVRCPREVSRD